MKAFLILISFVFGVPLACAEKIDPDKVIDRSIELIVSGKSTDAFNYAIKSNIYFEDIKAQIDSTRITFESLIKNFGVPYRCEKLITRNLLNRFRTDVYVCFAPKQPFEVIFEFYKPKDEWYLHSFSTDSNIDEYINESIKAEIGKKSIVEKLEK